MTTIADSSILIGLSRVGHLDLLPRLYGRVVIPTAVHTEVTLDPDLAGSSAVGAALGEWLRLGSPATTAVDASGLSPGEWEAISLAYEECAAGRPVRLLMDERRGRRRAEALGLRPVGVLGILLAARRQGLLAELAPVLDDLQAAGFRFSQALRQQVLAAAGEEG